MRGAVCVAALVLALWVAFERMRQRDHTCTRVWFRPSDGIFSNVIVCVEIALCFPQFRIECAGWPADVIAALPNIPVAPESACAGTDTPLEETIGLGHKCRIAQDPRILQSMSGASGAGIREQIHRYLAPGAAFAPAPALVAEARAWWDANVSATKVDQGPRSTKVDQMPQSGAGAPFVIGVHGRAATHFGSADLAWHVGRLADDVDDEIRARPGARVLLATCNETIARLMRERLGDRMAWRRPEGPISVGNADWGDAVQRVTGDIARGAVTDAILLGMCDVLVCGSSNVALYVAGLAPSLRIRLARHLTNVAGL
jgi:hypothetical protein